jgi:hypothetical protein
MPAGWRGVEETAERKEEEKSKKKRRGKASFRPRARRR